MAENPDSYQKLREKVARNGLYGASLYNTSIVLWMLDDHEKGLHVGREKGARSPGRLVTLVRRMSSLCYLVRQKFGPGTRLTSLTERDVIELFSDVRAGRVTGKQGPLKDVGTLAETFVQFWHWWMKAQREQGLIVDSTTVNLDTQNDYKPPWVYLNEKQQKQLAEACNAEYRALVYFMIDSGVRPEELQRLRISDVSKDGRNTTWLDVSDEIAKKGSHGRRIKLIVCDKLLWQHIKRTGRGPDEPLFAKSNEAAKKYLRERSIKLFGWDRTAARNTYDKLSLYDLRHNAACYWRKRYKDFNAFMYRMGWKDPSRAYYYDELLGMKDTIQEDHLLVGEDATRLEEELEKERQERQRTQDELKSIQEQMVELQEAMEVVGLWQRLEILRSDQSKSPNADAPHWDKRSELLRIKKLVDQRLGDM